VHTRKKKVRAVFNDMIVKIRSWYNFLATTDFAYPPTVIPSGSLVLVTALWIHLAKSHGYKRVGNDVYVPITDEGGRSFYRAVPVEDVLTTVFNYDKTRNICTHVL